MDMVKLSSNHKVAASPARATYTSFALRVTFAGESDARTFYVLADTLEDAMVKLADKLGRQTYTVELA